MGFDDVIVRVYTVYTAHAVYCILQRAGYPAVIQNEAAEIAVYDHTTHTLQHSSSIYCRPRGVYIQCILQLYFHTLYLYCTSVRVLVKSTQTDRQKDIRTQATCHTHGRVFLMCYSQPYEGTFCAINFSYV